MFGTLARLERIPEITSRLDLIDNLRARARSLEPLDGVETMALSDYERDWLVRYTYNSNAIEVLRTVWPTCVNTRPGNVNSTWN